MKLLAFFHWLNNFISKIFSLLISSLVNTYDNTSDYVFLVLEFSLNI